MWNEPLGRALTRQTDGLNPTILDDPRDARRNLMQELLVDFITSLDGYGAGVKSGRR